MKDNNDLNTFCKKIKIKRNPNCDIKDNGGKYEIMNLYDYVKKNKRKYHNFKIRKEDNVKYILLYRYDSEYTYGKDILKYFYDYKTTIKKYLKKEIYLNWVEIPIYYTEHSDKWGHRPGIGINLSYRPELFYIKEDLEEPNIISEFWIPIKINNKPTDISVCCITEECT
jgi:hypothetical protein